MSMLTKRIDRSLCDVCGQCIEICVGNRVLAKAADGFPVYAKEHKCIECGHCLALCPRGAISFEGGDDRAPGTSFAPSRDLERPSDFPRRVLELLFSLRSARAFDGREVDRAVLGTVLEAMVRSPSAGNEQNRSFIVLGSKAAVDELDGLAVGHYARSTARLRSPVARKLAARAMAGRDMSKVVMRNRIMADLPKKERLALALSLFDDLVALYAEDGYRLFHGAPAAIVVTSSTNTSAFHTSFHKADVEIAITHGTVAAAALGLASCRMGLTEMAFAADKGLKARYSIPEGERVDGVLALGYSPLQWKRLPPRGPVKAVWV
jgi:nitroreductase/NAD-dependent dihydropyrimidine dehydrogenase PreA subunit